MLSLKKIRSKAASYCYGNRVIYADSAYAFPLWEDMWDVEGNPSKFAALFLLSVDVPNGGPVDTAALDVEVWGDIQRAIVVSEPAQGRPYYIDRHQGSTITTLAIRLQQD